MDPNVILNRIGRLARLDTTVFDEVRDDQNETIPAIIVLAVSAILAGFGAFLWWKVVPDDRLGEPDSLVINTLVLGPIFMIAMYGVAAMVAYVVLAQMYKIQVDLMSLVRTMGYGALPLAISVVMFVPIIWPLFAILPLALLLVMMIYAIQSASGADSTQVVMAAIIGLAVFIVVLGLISLSGDDAPMGAGHFGVLYDFN
ncbi:MAG: hypothetical protein IT303_00515 [Dehalococcoidia bacterium]|nr:hypothetical protein [Dehalococcoidia bacterium]